MQLKLTNKQTLILISLAVIDCLVVFGLGGVVVTQTLKTNRRPPPTLVTAVSGDEPSITATPLTLPTSRPVPPTWTPASSPTPPGMEMLYTFAPDRCMFDVPDGADVTCGYAVLPEMRGDPPAGIVRLAVAVYHSSVPDSAPDPAIYLSGGPGGAALNDMALLYDDFIAPLLTERDVIIFDQRGVGLSQPALECNEFTAVVEDDLEQHFTTAEKAKAYPVALRRCRDHLTLRGVNLAAYTSAANASDVRDLAAILGYDQVNLYGVSYGTRLALTVMRDHPEVVRSAVLDSVEPIEEPMYNRHAASTARLLRKLFDGCAADPVCNARYPNLERVFYDLVDRLNAEPATVWAKSVGYKMYKIQLTGDLLTGGIFSAAYSSSVVPFLPRMIYDAALGDYELAEWIMGISVRSDLGISIGMMLSVNCCEETFATTPEQIVADFELYPDTAGYAYEAVFGDPQTLFTICQEWGAASFDPREGQPVSSEIPTLILAGEYDPITPPDYGRQVAEQLSHSYFYEFPGQGHGVSLLASDCAYRMARDFLDDPLSGPDASCIATMTGPDFY
jgi:pimeloyl-ACP methyl ester carboxylesterase